MEAERLPEVRASDGDRERVLARLRDAHAEGRLDGTEFYERLDAVYNARTYGELAVLTRDLPAIPAPPNQSVRARPTPATPATSPAPGSADLPGPLRGLWGLWAFVVLVNVLIWGAVSLGTWDAQYFWPIWVAGPWGAVLLALSIAWLAAHRSGRGRSH